MKKFQLNIMGIAMAATLMALKNHNSSILNNLLIFLLIALLTGMFLVVQKSAKSYKRERDRLYSILDSMDDCVYIVNAAWEIEYANPAFKKNFQVLEKVGLKGKCYEVLHQSNSPCADCRLKEVIEGQRFRSTLKAINGKLFDCILTPLVSPDGSVSKLTIFRDVTQKEKADAELKKSEEKFKNLSMSLEEKVAKRTALAELRARQLKRFALSLSESEQEQKRLLADQVHNHLQQLIVAALVRAKKIKRKVDCEFNNQENIRKIIVLLEQSVTETRKISVSLSPPVLSFSNINHALQWLATWMKDQYEFIVFMQVSENITIEDTRLRYFIFESVKELLFNSYKHSGNDKAEVSVTEIENAYLKIQVKDEGKGLDVFSLTNQQKEGKGFGIFSIREKVEVFGGNFLIDSSPGKGFQATITFPIKLTKIKKQRKEDSPFSFSNPTFNKASNKRIRAVVADDHKIVRKGIVNVLEEQPDIGVIGEAENGYQAIELVKAIHPDVLILDVNMPELNGIDALNLLRGSGFKLPVVILSVNDDKLMIETLLKTANVSYCNKTESSEILIRKIRKLINLMHIT